MSKTSEKIYIGCDVSKDTLDFAIRVPDVKERSYPHITVGNSLDGFRQFRKWVKEQDVTWKNVVVGMEHTGVYSESLCEWLFKAKVPFYLLNPDVLHGTGKVMRGKNDEIDSQRLAKYIYTNHEDLEFGEPVKPIFKQLRALRVERKNAIQARTKFKNELATLSEKSSSAKRITKAIKTLTEQIKAVEKEIIELMETDDSISKNYKLILSVAGIGKVNAASLIISTCNFTRFSNARQYAAYISVAPFAEKSGRSINKPAKVTKQGHLEYKAELTQAAQVAARHNPEMREYYARRVAEGKSWQKVLNIIKFKLLLRVFAVVKRGTPYVDTMKFKS